MTAILQMDLEALDAHAGARVVQLAGTVETADAGVVTEADVPAGREVGRGRVGRVGHRVDGGAPHRPFEPRVRVLTVQRGEGGGEPGGWGGLLGGKRTGMVSPCPWGGGE